MWSSSMWMHSLQAPHSSRLAERRSQYKPTDYLAFGEIPDSSACERPVQFPECCGYRWEFSHLFYCRSRNSWQSSSSSNSSPGHMPRVESLINGRDMIKNCGGIRLLLFTMDVWIWMLMVRTRNGWCRCAIQWAYNFYVRNVKFRRDEYFQTLQLNDSHQLQM